MPWYGFTAYERQMRGVRGFVEAEDSEHAKALIDAGKVDVCPNDFDGPEILGYDLIEIWECEE